MRNDNSLILILFQRLTRTSNFTFPQRHEPVWTVMVKSSLRAIECTFRTIFLKNFADDVATVRIVLFILSLQWGYRWGSHVWQLTVKNPMHQKPIEKDVWRVIFHGTTSFEPRANGSLRLWEYSITLFGPIRVQSNSLYKSRWSAKEIDANPWRADVS